jgi:(p)ppGpp synthase/HD superfamily hydrolase
MIRQFELVERVKAYDPGADEDLLNRAYVFSMKAHGSQSRASGDPYFSHPLGVAEIAPDWRHPITDIPISELIRRLPRDQVTRPLQE